MGREILLDSLKLSKLTVIIFFTLHSANLNQYIVDPKIVIKIYNISTLHKNMYVLKYSILNSFAQNPAI